MIRVLTFAMAAVAAAAPVHRQDRGAEPPYRLSVEIDGVVVQVVDGERGEVTIGDRKLPIRATVLPTRILDAKGVRFEFPRSMAFEVDSEEYLDHWALDGGDCTILLERFGGVDGPSAAELLESMTQQTGGVVEDPKPVALTLGKVKVKGVVGMLMIGSSGIQTTVVRLEAGGATYLLVLQDMLDEQGEMTQESKQVREILARTFEVAQDKR
ncbi:MAG: hypothetical protein H6838_02555 [Planctomycetes bacterium]|nr:hypothetical protein [Planctomycetota bacterium]MCB9884341.1 hypothetical protein [Planctomycetota bacterium]